MGKQALKNKEQSVKRNKQTKKNKKKLKTQKQKKSAKLSSKSLTARTTELNKNNSIIKKGKISSIELISQNMDFYCENLANNHFETYANDIVTDLLFKESNENRKLINETIVKKFNLTNEHRKNGIKYLYNFIKFHNFSIRCYFSTVAIFDLFLINYSEDEYNEDKCKIFFNSKKTNEISLTKIILLELCCFYLTSKYYNTKLVSLEQLLYFENAKEEVNYDDLINLVDEIIIYSGANISNENIYSFIEIFMFDILNSMKNLTKNKKFLNRFENYVVFFGTRFVQDIHESNIFDSIQVLGIIIFGFEFSKDSCEENNESLDNYLIQWKDKLKEMMKIYDANQLEYVIKWLNNYVSCKYMSKN